MLPLFANPAGWWALAGVPVVLAIHFLQQRRRTLLVSTYFLLEPLAPESRGGRTWDRLRGSRQLWLQLLAVVLAAWVLAEPRWLREESAQTVAVVLDASASMAAFREPTERATERLLASRDGLAVRTEWLVMTTDRRQPALYRGTDRRAAMAALARWQPALGVHEIAPVLRLAQQLAGPNGLTWLITDARAKVPAAQPALGVGRPLSNVGFAGASVGRENGGVIWRALVQNHTDAPVTRDWWFEVAGASSPKQTLTLGPGALVEVSGRLPDGVERATVQLSADEFASDDRLPLVRPVAKPLAVSVEIAGEVGNYFRKVAGSVDGVYFTPGAKPGVRVLRLAPATARPVGAAVLLPPEPSASLEAKIERAPLVVERHALLADLNWQGWFGAGAGPLTRANSDTVLLWQFDQPLAWLSGAEEAPQLTLNFYWEFSNSARLPAPLLLLRRHLEGVRDAQPGFFAANYDTLASITLASADLAGVGANGGAGAMVMEFQALREGAVAEVRSLGPAEVAALRAPAEPGFFALRRGETVLVRGATQFADPRQGNFRGAETFTTGAPPEAAALFTRNTRPDPFVAVWLALLGGCLLGSWWPSRTKGETSELPGATARSAP